MPSRCRPPPPPPPPPPPVSCPHAAGECAAAACVLCACCPLALLWCCVQIPFRLAWCAAGAACGSSGRRLRRRDRLVGASSSFSDIDLDADLFEATSGGAEKEKGRCFGWIGRRRRRDRVLPSSPSSGGSVILW